MKKIVVKKFFFSTHIKYDKSILSKTSRTTLKKRYQHHSEEEKDKRRKKVRDRYKNLPEEKQNKNYASI